MNGRHDTPLVALSILIAICASYTALSLAGRVAIARGRVRAAWLLGGSIAMGTGIWSMHFVAMLAFHLPVIIAYDVPLVALSYLAAMAASAFALFVASQPKVSPIRLIAAGQCLGLAVVAMHYTGMAAVRAPAHLGYDPVLVAASVLIAVGASTVALWLFMWLREDNSVRGQIFRGCAAVVMGLAIAGMHYTAMAAARFTAMPGHVPGSGGFLLGSSGLAMPVAIGAFVVLTLALLGAMTDHWVRMKLAGGEALRLSEERYRSVVSEIDEVIFRTDAAGRLTFLNAAWTQMTGASVAESMGAVLMDSVHPADRMEITGEFAALTAGDADYYRHEVRCLAPDGTAKWVEIHARASRDAAGRLVGTAGVIRDFTDRRLAEEALRRAREVAEAANHAKSEFLSRMSHELRTPLNAILGFGQLMELDAVTPDHAENADQILKAGRHLLSLINEVLDITSIEAGHLPLSAEPVCVGDVAAEVLKLMEPLAAARRITLSVEGPALFTEFVHADRQRLKQVLLNLVANAVKYNRDGGSARIETEVMDDSLRIVVIDNGPGIAADKMPRLFTPFDRLGTDQMVEGTGLGLALSRRLAEAMGGSLGAESVEGSGSRFWIELRCATSQLARLDVAALEGVVALAVPVGSPRRRILYVEDNLSNLTLMQRLLARHDSIELIPAISGGLALDLARLHRPDLVLLDLHLPDIPGEEVLRQLRQDPVCRDMPVVVLSADATPGQIERLITSGARAYLTKPLELKGFMTLLQSVLDLKEAA
jgi:PAS domain S-box-containing protein